MKDEIVLALFSALNEELESKISASIPLQLTPIRGKTGKGFIFEDHKSIIEEIVISNLTSNLHFLESCKGETGERGEDGRDGKDFSFLENTGKIKDLILSLKDSIQISVSEISEELKQELKGKDFSIENSLEGIKSLLSSQEIVENFRLRFSDLTDKEVEDLKGDKGEIGPEGQKGPRGLRGQKGKDGKDFSLEEHIDFFQTLKPKFEDFTEEEKDSLKLKFENLTEEEKDSLKLKFENLTDSQRDSLLLKFTHLTTQEKLEIKGDKGETGLRGPEGRPGRDVEQKDIEEVVVLKKDLLRGLQGLQGVPGVAGVAGVKGKDGKDGEDAPLIEKISFIERGKELALRIELEDGTEYSTNFIDFPEKIVQQFYSPAGFTSSSSSSSSSGKANLTVEFLDQDSTLLQGDYFEQIVSPITTTLPLTPELGRLVYIANYSSGKNTLDGNGQDVIGANTVEIKRNEVFTLLYNGNEWRLV